MHLCSLADGQTKPCGIAEEFQPIMNLNNMSVEEIFNSDKMKELRKDMKFVKFVIKKKMKENQALDNFIIQMICGIIRK